MTQILVFKEILNGLRIAPYRLIAVFQLAGSDALHYKVPVHSIFLFCHYVAEGCPLAIPFPTKTLLLQPWVSQHLPFYLLCFFLVVKTPEVTR